MLINATFRTFKDAIAAAEVNEYGVHQMKFGQLHIYQHKLECNFVLDDKVIGKMTFYDEDMVHLIPVDEAERALYDKETILPLDTCIATRNMTIDRAFTRHNGVNIRLMIDRFLPDERVIINMTPHTITIMDSDNNPIHEFLSAGVVRCEVTRECESHIGDIPINKTHFGELLNLPEYKRGTYYILSAIAAQAAAAQGRTDCLITDDAVRDDSGRIIGCRALAQI